MYDDYLYLVVVFEKKKIPDSWKKKIPDSDVQLLSSLSWYVRKSIVGVCRPDIIGHYVAGRVIHIELKQ